MPPGIAEAARPVVVECVIRAHLAVGVDLETRLLNAAARATVDARVAPRAGDLPALVVRVVVGTQVHLRRERDVPHAAYPVVVLPQDRRRRVDRYARHDLGAADPCPHLGDRSEQPERGRELVPAVVEHQDATTVLHLLELPVVAAHRHIPTAAAAPDHLHVVSADGTDLARLDGCLQLPQRFVEEVVLHHPQHPIVRLRGVDHPLRLGEVVAHGLLQVDVPAVAEQFDHAVDVQRNRQQGFDRVDLYIARRELRGRRERARVRPIALPFGAAFLARVDQRDHLHVGIVVVRAHVEVVDAAEPDEGRAHGTVVGSEAHGVRVSCCSSMVLPAGSAIQIWTMPSPWTPRVYSMPRASSSRIAPTRSSTATQ